MLVFTQFQIGDSVKLEQQLCFLQCTKILDECMCATYNNKDSGCNLYADGEAGGHLPPTTDIVTLFCRHTMVRSSAH